METTILDQPLKFWATDNINQVSQKKMGREADSPTYRDMFVEFVTRAYEQEGKIAELTRGNRELKELGRDSAGQVEVLTFQIQVRDEILATPPDELATYIARLGEELRALEETAVPEQEVDARERQVGIEKLGVKLELAQGYQKVIGPFVEELTAAAAVKRSGDELEVAQRQFEEDAQVKLLTGQIEEAREAQRVAEQALLEQQTANEELKAEHIRLTQVADEAAAERERGLREQLDAMREQNAQLTERVRVLGEAPEAGVQLKAEMLDRVAVAVLGADPDLGQLEARVGEHIAAEGRLGQLYDLAHIPRGVDAFNAIVGMIQSVARIFTTWGRGDAQSLAAYAAHFEPNVAEINRKAGEYDGVVFARDNAVRDLGEAQLDLVREQANSKKLLSILGNGFSWTWSTTTAVHRFIYDAMRF